MNINQLSFFLKSVCRIALRHTLFLCAFFPVLSISAQISVLPNQSAIALSRNLAGQGVTVLNPVLTCPGQANGFFKAVNSNLGLDSGIVLTTGRAATLGSFYGVNGPANVLASTDCGFAGDAELNILAGQTTQDACKLEFDVIPQGDTISINYVFSSEEYNSAVCGPFNDAFAFFISGPGIATADNMALVPGTNIPVTINSINNGIPGSTGNIINCTNMGTGSPFTAYYKENGTGSTLTHKGLTTVLKAVHKVTPCGRYHLKIVIADAGNGKYDSGVFLEAGSLKTGDYKVRAISAVAGVNNEHVCVKGCQPARFRIKRTLPKSQPQTIHYTTYGTAIAGVDYTALADSAVIPAFDTITDVVVNGLPTPLAGPKKVQMILFSPSVCSSTTSIIDSAVIIIYDTIHVALQPADTAICGGDSILMRVTGDSIYRYNWAPDVSIADTGVKQAIVFPETSTEYTLTVSVPGSLCPNKTVSGNIRVKLTPHPMITDDTLVCYNTTFQLTPSIVPDNSFYSYQWTGPAAFTATTLSAALSNVFAGNGGAYTIVVKNDTNGCRGKATIKVIVNMPDTPAIRPLINFCLNSTPVFPQISGNQLLWYNAAGGAPTPYPPVPPTDVPGHFVYYVSQESGNCESPKVNVQVYISKCCDGNIFIPSGFTPNSDGHNDKFRPLPDFGYFLKSMAVYDRWGQEIFSSNIGSWDGNIGATPAPGGVYFYRMIFGCVLGGSEERVGDITLIR